MVHGASPRLTRAEFEDAVEEALAQIPAPLRRELSNVAIFVEAEPPAGDEDLLGVYEGTPITERDDAWMGTLPDRIVIFQGPLQRLTNSREHLIDEIAVTVVHEIAHHFGIDDDRLHALGWG